MGEAKIKKWTQESYNIGRPSFILNRKIKRGARIFLNGLLLQPGYDYKIGKRNVKFNVQLEKHDIVCVEVSE